MSGQTNLLSLLMVAAILAILGVVGWGFYYGASVNIELEETQNKIAAALREAKAKAMAGENYASWGVHFENPAGPADVFFVVFQGPTYSGSPSIITTYLPSIVDFGSPGGPLDGASEDITFAKRTGTITAANSVTIQMRNNTSQQKTVSVSTEGLITKN